MGHSLAQALRAKRGLVVEGLPKAGLAYLLARERLDVPVLLVAADEERAETLWRDLRAFGVDAALFASLGHTPYTEASPDARLVAARLALRHQLMVGDRPQVVVATATTLLGRLSPLTDFRQACRVFQQGDEIDRDEVATYLLRIGYQRVSIVEDEGTFAIRGGIVDVYPPAASGPQRLDLFGDEIASIKSFDATTQRTYAAQPRLSLHPIREIIFDDTAIARAVAFLRDYGERVAIPTRRIRELCEEVTTRNYFFGIESLWPAFFAGSVPVIDELLAASTVVALDEPDNLTEVLGSFYEHALAERERALCDQRVALDVEAHLIEPDDLERRWQKGPCLLAKPFADAQADEVFQHGMTDLTALARELELRRKGVGKGEILDPLMAELHRRFDEGEEVLLTCGSRGQAERLHELLLGRRVDLPIEQGLAPGAAKVARRAIVLAELSCGLVDRLHKRVLITESEIFGTPPRRSRRPRRPVASLSLADLRPGELVVHTDCGIGRYVGLSRLVLGGVDGDYVHLEYQGGDKLYLPVYRLGVLQRYRGPAGAKLDKLGGNRWLRAKERVRDAVLALAHNLLSLQARRVALPGFALAAPDESFGAFEASFPYEETPDQQRAILEVLADLQRDVPMDRLVCGDVGFGKTEVAMRAAYWTVLSGKQVAVLVPTTVLAEQHGMTFRERLEPLGVNVEVLSRFRSPKQVSGIVAGLRRGSLDIVVGTHRLLSSDVGFRSLGLLVIDEEHRFGVRHKERIKALRSHVHVLTLSATPIPRTLHMAMVGLRDLSIIQTPPEERTAIRTEVTRFDEELIAEVIRRELHRGGQVFVVHNRVRSIGAMAQLVRRLVPEAKVAVAHGQLSAEPLERIMVDFIHRRIDVLVCTAIIESGIDIPAANTMIINRADMFGLAQLHQLRGRIGRSRERAFAYLLLPRSSRITREAGERLGVLRRFSDLGAGFHIASQDLDLRGAGDLLGADQSGNIQAVGFELYTQLLADAVEQARGHKHAQLVEPEIKLPVVAVLPEDYVPEPMRRLAYYQRLSQADSDAAIFDICAEIEETYGPAPSELAQLAEVMVIRRRLLALGAQTLVANHVDGELRIGVSFVDAAPLDREALTRLLLSQPDRFRLQPSGRLAIFQATGTELSALALLQTVRQALGMLPVVAPAVMMAC